MPTTPRVARWSAALPAAAVPVWLLLTHGVSPGQLVAYGGYLVLGVVLPGLLVARALLGRSPLLVADLAVGAATGTMLQLGAWFVAVSAGAGSLLRWWPLVVYVTFAVVRPLRRHWVPGGHPERLSVPVAWVLSLSAAAVSAWWTGLMAWTGSVADRHQWPFDLYWHLGLVELFSRQVRPEDSQVAGEHLAYHWFASADAAGASLMSGVDAATVLSRLWVMPTAAVTVGLFVALLREVSRRGPRMAAVAAALLAAPAGIVVVPWLDVPWDNTFAPFSPSQNYSYPILLLTLLLVVRYLRSGGRRVLVLVGCLLVLSPGVKATHLPLVLSGLLLALAVAVLFRAAWRRTAALVLMATIGLGVGTVLIGAGGAAGSAVQLLSTLRRNPVYFQFVGLSARESALPGGLLPPGLGSTGAKVVLGLILLATVVKGLWVLPGLVPLRVRRHEADVVAWFLFGGGLSGWLLMLLVDQSGLSQVYFVSTGGIFWFLLVGWGAVVLGDRALAALGHAATVRAAGAGAACAFLVVSMLHRLTPWRPPVDETASGLAVAVVPAALIVAGTVASMVVLRSRPDHVLATAVALSAGLLTAALVSHSVVSLTARPPAKPGPYAVTAAESAAARWIDQHAGPHDVVATNVHCLGPRTRAGCDARAFWVSALTARRTFIGGWGYLDRTREMAGRNDRVSTRQPFYDQEAFRLNESLFSEPTPAVASELARRGVGWIFADARRGDVSARLADVADLVHSTGDVEVYRLRPVTATPSS